MAECPIIPDRKVESLDTRIKETRDAIAKIEGSIAATDIIERSRLISYEAKLLRFKRGEKLGPVKGLSPKTKGARHAFAIDKSNEFVKIQVPMCVQFEAFFPPPNGHLGVWAVQENPSLSHGQKILFHSNKQIFLQGVVTYVEPPDSNVRPDMKPFKAWYKIHWMPVDMTELTNLIGSFSAHDCPQCQKRTKVNDSRVEGHRIVRTRICRRHSPAIAFRTIEVPISMVETRHKALSRRRRK